MPEALLREASIDAAERLFDQRRTLAAELLLRELERDGEGEHLVAVRSDLGVVLAERGALREAELTLFEALLDDPVSDAVLSNLAELSERRGDSVAAEYWWARLLEASPQEKGARARLQRLREARAPDPGARAGHSRECAPSALSSGRHDPTRVLLVVNYFYPSVGGTERLSEQTAISLRDCGMSVEIAAAALPERTELDRLGFPIHEIGNDREGELRRVLQAGGYEAVVIQSDPLDWPMTATLGVVDPSVRVVAVPCVNAENYATLQSDPRAMGTVVQSLRRAAAVCVSSQGGFDRRFATEQGFSAAYLPNATQRLEPSAGFRSRQGFDASKPLFLSVGNFWPVKNHLGLLSSLALDNGDWQLAVIGRPAAHEPALAREIEAAAARDQRVTLLGGLSPQDVADAMHESDGLLLPSMAEATPMVVVEAMSQGLPWIATPSCGAVHDHAGGLIVPLEHFADAMAFLVDHPDASAALGEAGHRHWSAAYTWETVGPRYAALIRGQAPPAAPDPTEFVSATEGLRARYYAELPSRSTRRRRSACSASRRWPSVTCIMTAYNYEEYVGEALESVLAQTYPESLLDVVVVDDGSTDGTTSVVGRVAKESGGRVRLVQRANGGLVAATNTALEHARGDLIGICDADDCWLPDRVGSQVEIMLADPGVSLVYADMQVIDPHGVVTADSYFEEEKVKPLSGRVLDELSELNFTTNATLMFRTGQVPRIPDGLPFADYWIASHAAAAGRVVAVERPLAQYRLHSRNMGFGADDPAGVLRRVRGDIAHRRVMLGESLGESVSALALARAAFNFDRDAQWAIKTCGTFFVELVDVTDADRARSSELMEEARTAEDGEERLRAYARALLKDPFNRAARTAILTIVNGSQP